MARSPVTVSKEGDATSAVEETVPFDDDTLKGEDKYVISYQYYDSQFYCQFEGSLLKFCTENAGGKHKSIMTQILFQKILINALQL